MFRNQQFNYNMNYLKNQYVFAINPESYTYDFNTLKDIIY